MKTRLSNIPVLRRLVLGTIKTFNHDRTIRHHHTKKPFFLNLYKHKGYWYHGLHREEETMEIFGSWVNPGSKVLEIGGHVGYLATYFAHLTGENGKVVVFEPDQKNRAYLTKNVSLSGFQNIDIVAKGAGNENTTMEFYVDPITGQNNSLVKDFKGFYANRSRSASTKSDLQSVQIEVIKLDDFCMEYPFQPDIIKIDVEGFEYEVVLGFANYIKSQHPKMMIEIQSNEEKIINFFLKEGYSLFNEKKVMLDSYDSYLKNKTMNIFFVHE